MSTMLNKNHVMANLHSFILEKKHKLVFSALMFPLNQSSFFTNQLLKTNTCKLSLKNRKKLIQMFFCWP